MRIGIDGYEANIKNRVGIGRFAFEVIKGLYELNTSDEYTIFIPGEKLSDLPRQRDGWQYKVISNSRFWTYKTLPLALKGKDFDVFFSPTHYIPLFSSVNHICSIMDLSYIYFPKLFRFKDLIQLRLGTYYSVKASKKIITISQFTKNAIIKYYKVNADKVVVAYPGFDKKIFNNQKSEHQIDADYIAYVGTLQPRKNITRLIEAFQKIKNREIKLLIIGKKGWYYNKFFSKVKKNNLTDRIIFTDFVTDNDLSNLLKGSKCFVLPSLYEGFGIPTVEAMACGIPVVVSDVSSLPEVVGDSGIYIDPYNVESIAQGIKRAISLSERERKTYINKGFKQVEKYDWKLCANIVYKTLREI